MAFFTYLPALPEADEDQVQIPAWVHPNQDEIPVAVPLVRELARVPGAALFLQRADVYSEGVSFVFTLRVRLSKDLPESQLEKLRGIDGSFGFGRSRVDPNLELRLGITLPGGAAVDSFSENRGEWDQKPDGPVLAAMGGGRGGDLTRWASEMSVWLWPLPASGQATLHFAYRGIGIEEGAIEFDTEPLVAAARHVLKA